MANDWIYYDGAGRNGRTGCEQTVELPKQGGKKRPDNSNPLPANTKPGTVHPDVAIARVCV